MADTVSIILAVYNMESCLRETMDSVLAQTYRDLEVICIDDGSTDASLSLLQAYAEHDDRVTVLSQENAGPAHARNRGLERATGEYVMLLDSDDVYDTEMVAKLYARAIETEADIVICRSRELDHGTGRVRDALWTVKAEQVPASDPFSCADMYDFAFSAFVGWPWDKLYRRSFVERNGLRFPALENSEDLCFVYLSLVRADAMSFVDEALIEHRVNRSGSVSNSRTKHPLEFYRGICMLKEALREDAAQYEKLAWGFLNWALEHTVWNIETLPASPERTMLVEKLARGEFAELEIEDHGEAYYALFPDSYRRYALLLAEAGALDQRDPRALGRHPSLRFVASFFSRAQRQGFRQACATVGGWLGRRAGKEQRTRDRARELRGTALPLRGAKPGGRSNARRTG